MFNGSTINDICVVGFDQLRFVTGLSSLAWNFWLLESLTNNTVGEFAKRDSSLRKRQSRPDGDNPEVLNLINLFESSFNLTLNDSLYAVYPNPFQGYNNSLVNEATLELVDGSESGQTIPFWPALQPAWAVDFIIAFDGSGETPLGWQNGTNMIDMYNAATAAGLKFPKVPTAETFIDFQYNELPTFCGCYEDDVPLVHGNLPEDS
jgi:lysophospholipase